MRPADWRDGVKGQVFDLVVSRVAIHEFCPSTKNNTFHRERCRIIDSVSPLIDCSSTDGRVLCSLNVGITCKELCLDPNRKHSALTWNIGYLMVGRWMEWSVTESGEIASVIEEMFHCFENVAIPWLERFATSGDVMKELSHNRPRGFSDLKRTARRPCWAG